jgi:hypothetical protein
VAEGGSGRCANATPGDAASAAAPSNKNFRMMFLLFTPVERDRVRRMGRCAILGASNITAKQHK